MYSLPFLSFSPLRLLRFMQLSGSEQKFVFLLHAECKLFEEKTLVLGEGKLFYNVFNFNLR